MEQTTSNVWKMEQYRKKLIDKDHTAYEIGDVFQINEKHGETTNRIGWVGALVTVREVKQWGIVGFVTFPHTHEEQTRAYIRLKWEEIDFVGHAPLTLLPDELPE
jgi:hypothetical protein